MGRLVGTIDVVDVKHFPERASPHASDTNSLERTAGLALDGADTYVVHAARRLINRRARRGLTGLGGRRRRRRRRAVRSDGREGDNEGPFVICWFFCELVSPCGEVPRASARTL
jgi:hypothetical protein